MEKLDFSEDINTRYSLLEHELNRKLDELNKQESLLFDAMNTSKAKEPHLKACLSQSEARKRNADILKNLEVSKARLRSRSVYSPIETILQEATANYQQQVSMCNSK